MNEPQPTHESSPGGTPQPRRSFLSEILSVVIGGAITIVPLVSGVIFFLDPILRKKKAAASGGAAEGSPGEGYLKVTSESAIPADGTPVFQKIRKDVVDAWTTYKDQPVGSVYLRKAEDGSLSCFNTECPHLGCTVGIEETEDGPQYKCPCHDSRFFLDGTPNNKIPPRPMDALDVQVSENGDVWVKFQSYKIGVKEQIPKS